MAECGDVDVLTSEVELVEYANSNVDSVVMMEQGIIQKWKHKARRDDH